MINPETYNDSSEDGRARLLRDVGVDESLIATHVKSTFGNLPQDIQTKLLK